jgi:hypothetical protein
MADGTVKEINIKRGMFIVAIDGGDFAVFELAGGIDIAVGDRIRGELEALGGETLRHLGQRQQFDVYGQSGSSSLVACQRLLGK